MTINKLTAALTLIACAPLVGAMQALDESELNQVTGEGLGAAFDNVVIASPDHGDPGAFSIKLNLTENGPEAIQIGELRFHCSVNESNCGRSPDGKPTGIQGGRGVGGYFGTYNDPYVTNTLKDVTDINGIDRTALSTAWPAAHLEQKERSFFDYTARGWNGKRFTSSIQTGTGIGGLNTNNGPDHYRGLPVDFFTNKSVTVGNLYDLSDQYAAYLKDHDDQLDVAANKFDLHFRIDAFTQENALKTGLNDQFIAYVDAIGARLYGTENVVWGQENRGLAMSLSLGLVADELRITSSPDGAIDSQLSLKGVDAYIPQGSVDQPMTISTVQFTQVQRGKWASQTMDTEARTQMRVEIAPLTASVGQAEQGHIFVQSIGFGSSDIDDPNPEIVTGVEDIYLRDASGNIVETIEDVKHRAFVPKTVIYNEQIDRHNKNNPSNVLPNIPNQNVIEIRGLEIQRMVMTTQDLNR